MLRTRIIVAVVAAGALLTVPAASAATAGLPSAGSDGDEHEPVRPNPAAATASCGVERWSVKTGTDSDAGLIDLGTPTSTTVADLDGLQPPGDLPDDSRIQPTETTLYQLQATLTEYKLEDDSDYHLVLTDDAGDTMIAEIPDPACVGSGSPLADGISTARSEFDAKYTATTSFQTANVPVTVEGVGFFDFDHGQTGVAPNAIELHPVLDIQFGTGQSSPIDDRADLAAPLVGAR